jgi:putative oxidoreductase
MPTRWQDTTASIGLLILRLGVGGYMLTHGWGKLGMVLGGRFDQFGDPIGLGSGLSLVLATFAEFFCALLVMAGLATRIAAFPIVFTMAVAAFLVHGADPWTSGRAFELFQAGRTEFPASKEPALIYLIVFLALILTGPGRYSIDAVLWPKLRRKRALKVKAGSSAG